MEVKYIKVNNDRTMEIAYHTERSFDDIDEFLQSNDITYSDWDINSESIHDHVLIIYDANFSMRTFVNLIN